METKRTVQNKQRQSYGSAVFHRVDTALTPFGRIRQLPTFFAEEGFDMGLANSNRGLYNYTE